MNVEPSSSHVLMSKSDDKEVPSTSKGNTFSPLIQIPAEEEPPGMPGEAPNI